MSVTSVSNARPRWVAVVVVSQLVILATLWTGGPRPAAAQVPDAGAQQQAVIDQLKATNEKLDKLVDLLASGNLQVRTAPPQHGR